MLQSFETLVPIFAIFFLGIFLKRIDLIEEFAFSSLSRFVFYVATPALLFRSVARLSLSEHLALDSVFAFYFSTIVTALLVYLFAFRSSIYRRGVIAQGAYRGNLAFFGLPVLVSRFGPDHPIIGTVTLLIGLGIPLYNLLGVILLSIPRTLRLHKDGDDSSSSSLTLILDIFKNPLILGTAAGAVASFFSFPVIEPLDRFVEMIGRTAAPLALIVVGGQFDLSTAKRDFLAPLLTSSAKLFLSPLIALALLLYLRVDSLIIYATVVMASAPTAVVSAIMAKEMGKDELLATNIVLNSTLLSLPSLLIWLTLLDMFFT